MALAWTAEKDKLLVDMKAAGCKWCQIIDVLRIAGLDKGQAHKHLKALERQGAQPAKTSRVEHAPVDIMHDKDGLTFLTSRNRLNPQQEREASDYRADFRELLSSGASIQSFLGNFGGVRGGGSKEGPTGRVTYAVDAQRRLFTKRYVVLGGQPDLLEVLDAVCGRGLTLQDMADGDGYRAKTLEALLKVALDQLAEARKQET